MDAPAADCHPPHAAPRRRRRRRRCWRRRRPARPGPDRAGRRTAAGRGIRKPDSLPVPPPPGRHPSMPKIEHIVVLMMENHSFDNLLGMVPYQVPGRAHVDGLTRRSGTADATSTATPAGSRSSPRTPARRASCTRRARARPGTPATCRTPTAATTASCEASGPIAMRFWDKARPAVHLLAGQALPDRRALLLLGAGPDLPQPPLPVRRHGLGTRRHRHGQTFTHPGRQRDDLRAARRARDRLGRLLPGPPELR